MKKYIFKKIVQLSKHVEILVNNLLLSRSGSNSLRVRVSLFVINVSMIVYIKIYNKYYILTMWYGVKVCTTVSSTVSFGSNPKFAHLLLLNYLGLLV